MATLLCIDPGSTLGYAIFDDGDLIEYGHIKTNTRLGQIERLAEMEAKLLKLFDEFRPSVAVIENVVPMAHRLKSRDAIFWVVGTFVLGSLIAEKYGCKQELVIPTSLKKIVAGTGKASKDLMISKVNEQLGLKLRKSEHNKADACGLGLYVLKAG